MSMPKELQVANLRKLASSAGLASDAIDFEAEVDATLSYRENKRLLAEKYNLEQKKPKDILLEKADFDQEQAIEAECTAEEQERKDLELIKAESVDLLGFYGILKDLVGMLNAGFCDSLWVIGSSGTGKTTQISCLLEGNVERIGGHITPYQLAKKLYDFKDNYTVFFDDTEAMLSNATAVSILKQALETTEHRFINWDSKNSLIPEKFEITSKIVFCVNSVPKDLGMKAVLNRSHRLDLDFDYWTFLKIMAIIAKSPKVQRNFTLEPEQRNEVFAFIQSNSSPATKDFSLRTQHKIEQYYAYSQEKWKSLALSLLKEDKEKALIFQLAQDSNYPTINEQQQEWSKRTGLGRSMYYEYKAKLCS